MTMRNKILRDRTIDFLDTESKGEWLRSFKGCEHYTDEEANDVISSLDAFAEILIEMDLAKIQHIDNQLFVSLKGQEKQKIAA
jgi:hypothetical protein